MTKNEVSFGSRWFSLKGLQLSTYTLWTFEDKTLLLLIL
jgi:hypothetical protein